MGWWQGPFKPRGRLPVMWLAELDEALTAPAAALKARSGRTETERSIMATELKTGLVLPDLDIQPLRILWVFPTLKEQAVEPCRVPTSRGNLPRKLLRKPFQLLRRKKQHPKPFPLQSPKERRSRSRPMINSNQRHRTPKHRPQKHRLQKRSLPRKQRQVQRINRQVTTRELQAK